MKQWLARLKKIMNNGGLFVIVLFFTYWIVFSNIDIEKMTDLLPKLKVGYLILGMSVFFLMVCTEALCIKRNLKLLGVKQKYILCVKYAFAGNFFSGLTPAATGGQPMQIYLMHKDNIPTSTGTLAILMELCVYQASITGFGVVGLVFFYSELSSLLGKYMIVVWVGIALNTAVLVITLVAMFSKKFSERFVKFAAKIVGFFRKSKKESFVRNSMKSLKQYQDSAIVLKENKGMYLLNSCLVLVRIAALNSAPFFIYKAFGFNQVGYGQLLAFQSVLFISCAAIPLPGATGVSESSFMLFFKNIFPSAVLGSAMVLSRGISFYFIMIFTGIALLIFNIMPKKKCAQAEVGMNENE